jgi:hypothetical protein
LILRRQLRGRCLAAIHFNTKVLSAEGLFSREYDVYRCQIAIAGVFDLVLNANLQLRRLARDEPDLARLLEDAVTRG